MHTRVLEGICPDCGEALTRIKLGIPQHSPRYRTAAKTATCLATVFDGGPLYAIEDWAECFWCHQYCRADSNSVTVVKAEELHKEWLGIIINRQYRRLEDIT